MNYTQGSQSKGFQYRGDGKGKGKSGGQSTGKGGPWGNPPMYGNQTVYGAWDNTWENSETWEHSAAAPRICGLSVTEENPGTTGFTLNDFGVKVKKTQGQYKKEKKTNINNPPDFRCENSFEICGHAVRDGRAQGWGCLLHATWPLHLLHFHIT